jgi:hypothetical protein
MSAAFGPNASSITFNAGRARLISSRVHSGFSSSGRDAASFAFLAIPSYLSPVRLSETDDMHSIATVRDDGDTETLAQQRHHPHPTLAVVPSRILDRQRGFPMEISRPFKGQATVGNVPGVLDGVKSDPHSNLRYSI